MGDIGAHGAASVGTALHVLCDPGVTQKVTQADRANPAGTKSTKTAPLTAAAIRAIRPPVTGRDTHADGATPGLALRVSAGGEWVWTLRMRDTTGEQRRLVLGEMTQEQGLAWARREAGKLRQGIRHGGRDPHRERREKSEANRLTLGVLVEDWRAIHLADRKPGYAAEAVRALRVAFKADLEVFVTLITRAPEPGKSGVARLAIERSFGLEVAPAVRPRSGPSGGVEPVRDVDLLGLGR